MQSAHQPISLLKNVKLARDIKLENGNIKREVNFCLENKPIGTATFIIFPKENGIHLDYFKIAPEYQGRGYGKLFFTMLLQEYVVDAKGLCCISDTGAQVWLTHSQPLTEGVYVSERLYGATANKLGLKVYNWGRDGYIIPHASRTPEFNLLAANELHVPSNIRKAPSITKQLAKTTAIPAKNPLEAAPVLDLSLENLRNPFPTSPVVPELASSAGIAAKTKIHSPNTSFFPLPNKKLFEIKIAQANHIMIFAKGDAQKEAIPELKFDNEIMDSFSQATKAANLNIIPLFCIQMKNPISENFKKQYANSSLTREQLTQALIESSTAAVIPQKGYADYYNLR